MSMSQITTNKDKRSLKKRLTNQKGVTLPLALLFFIVCAVIGSIILATATVASNRVGGLVSQQQPYYTTTSAAKMMKNILEGTSCELVYIKEDGQKVSESITYQGADSQLPPKFLEQVVATYKHLTLGQALVKQPLSFNLTSSQKELNLTEGTLALSSKEDTAYDIQMSFKTENKNNAYYCQLVAPSSVTTTEELLWYDTAGALVDNPSETDLSKCTKKTKITTTIKWPKATIQQAEVQN